MSTYEPYRPDETPDTDATAPAAKPAYETYDAEDDAAPAQARVVQSGSSTPRRTSRPLVYGPGRSNSSGAGAVAGIVVAAIAVVVVLVAANQSPTTGPTTDRDRYSSCAAEHDEDNSLFSDESWCDLELEGGNGNGLADEGGSGGPVEENSLFGDQDDDPFGYP